jgi:hypothetical protein
VQPQSAGVQVDPVPQVSYVLRAFVGYAGNVILIDQHDGGVVILGSLELLHVNHSPVGDAPSGFQPGAALSFNVFWRFRLAPQQHIHSEKRDATGRHQSIHSKRVHTKGRSKSA